MVIGVFSGCNNAGESTDPSTLTIEFVNADEAVAEGATLEIHAMMIGVDHYDPASCVAAWYSTVTAASFSVTMKEDNGAWNPTTEDWVGEGGWDKYDMTLLFDFDGDHYITPGSGERTNTYPTPIIIDGDTTVTVDYTIDLIAH